MKFVEVSAAAEFAAYCGGAIGSFFLTAGIKKGQIWPSLDILHLLPITVTLVALSYLSMKKIRQQSVTAPVWLAAVAGVGWLSGAWLATRFVSL